MLAGNPDAFLWNACTSSAEGWHLWRCQRHMGNCWGLGFKGNGQSDPLLKRGVCLMCNPQEAATFFMLNPPQKGQLWDHVGLTKSRHVHYIWDVPENHIPQSLNYISQGPATPSYGNPSYRFLQWHWARSSTAILNNPSKASKEKKKNSEVKLWDIGEKPWNSKEIFPKYTYVL